MSPFSMETQKYDQFKKDRKCLGIKESTRCCMHATFTNSSNIYANYTLAKCMINDGNYDAAYEFIRRISLIDPQCPFISILNGHLQLQNGCYLEAYKQFLKILNNDLFNGDLFLSYGFGLLYESIEKYNIARKWYSNLIKTNIEYWKAFEIIYRIGVCYKKDFMFEDSLKCFKWLLLQIDEEIWHYFIKLQIAHVYENMDMMDDCQKLLLELKSANHEILIVNRLFIWLLFKKKNFKEIKKKFLCTKKRKIIRDLKNFEYFYIEMVYCECDCKKQINDPYIVYLLGKVFAEEGNNEMAIGIYKHCISLDTSFYLAYNSLGVIYFNLKKYEIALNNFKKACSIKLIFPEAENNILATERVFKNSSTTIKVIDSNSNLLFTKYLDSEILFNGNIHFIKFKDLVQISDVLPVKQDEEVYCMGWYN